MRQATELVAAANHPPNISSSSPGFFNHEPTLADLFSDPNGGKEDASPVIDRERRRDRQVVAIASTFVNRQPIR